IGGACFNESIFKSPLAFTNCIFEGPTSFERAKFEHAPDFHGSQLHANTNFYDAQYSITGKNIGKTKDITASTLNKNESIWRQLKNVMSTTKNKELELKYFEHEMICRTIRYRKEKKYIRAAGIKLYQFTSNFGQ